MTNEQQQVKEWMQAFGQECPEKPTIPSLEVRKLRAKLILEEALETIAALNIGVYVEDTDNEMACLQDVSDFTFTEWDGPARPSPNLKEILDGCEDLKVVVEGTLAACGLVKNNNADASVETPDIHKDLAFQEVMRSNWTKLWTNEEYKKELSASLTSELEFFRVNKTNRCWLVKDSTGKVIKSPSYSPPNLEQFCKP